MAKISSIAKEAKIDKKVSSLHKNKAYIKTDRPIINLSKGKVILPIIAHSLTVLSVLTVHLNESISDSV